MEADDHPITSLDAAMDQRIGKTICLGFQFGVSQPEPGVDQRYLLRETLGRLLQEVMDEHKLTVERKRLYSSSPNPTCATPPFLRGYPAPVSSAKKPVRTS